MSENVVTDEKKIEVNKEVKRFNINVNSGKDEAGNDILFTFSGPEKSHLGLIYDAAHRIITEVIAIIQKRGEDLKPKDGTPKESDESVKVENK